MMLYPETHPSPSFGSRGPPASGPVSRPTALSCTGRPCHPQGWMGLPPTSLPFTENKRIPIANMEVGVQAAVAGGLHARCLLTARTGQRAGGGGVRGVRAFGVLVRRSCRGSWKAGYPRHARLWPSYNTSIVYSRESPGLLCAVLAGRYGMHARHANGACERHPHACARPPRHCRIGGNAWTATSYYCIRGIS
jgi:hypothetical protein